jgi:uncharacterized Fe-S cluster-containing radical SAM superfamily enzyme
MINITSEEINKFIEWKRKVNYGKSSYQYTFMKWWMEQLQLGSYKEREDKRKFQCFKDKLRAYEETPLHILIKGEYIKGGHYGQ